jgi:tyrosinase
MKKPPRAPKDKVPGVNNRFDDFVATHMTQAMMLHDPTHLFASHKYYIWLYEQALRNECGYKGYQPVRTEETDYMRATKLTML